MADNELKVGVTVSSSGAEAGAKAAADSFQTAADRITQAINKMSANMQGANSVMMGQLGQMASAAQGAATKTTQASAHIMAGSSGIVREAIVMAREIGRGDMTRLAGSASILAQRLGLLEVAMTPLGGLAVAAGAAFVAMGVAAVQASVQFHALQNALTLTANASGLAGDKFDAVAQEMADAGSHGIRDARRALVELAQTGAFTGQNIALVGNVVLRLSELTGEKSEKIVQDFSRITQEGVLRWAAKHQEVLDNVDTKTLQYIHTLEQQGKEQQAIATLMTALNNKLNDTSEALGNQQTILGEAKNAWQSFWQKVVDANDEAKAEDLLNRLGQKLYMLQDLARIPLVGGLFSGMISGTKAEIANQQELQRLHQRELDNIAKETEARSAANKKYLDDTLHHHAGPHAVGPSAAMAVAKAEQQAELAMTREKLATEQRLLETSYRNNELTTVQYYTRRREIIQENYKAEIDAQQKELQGAQTAASHAKNDSQRLESQATIVRLQGQLNLLRQKEVDQLRLVSAEQEHVATQQQKQLDAIKAQTAEKIALMSLDKGDKIGGKKAPVGGKTDVEIVQDQEKTENRRYEIVMEFLRKRLAAEGQTPVEIARINSQIEIEEATHQQKLSSLAGQQAKAMQEPFQKVADLLKTSFTSFFDSLADRTKSVKEKFMGLVDGILKGLTQIGTNMIMAELFGGGGGGTGGVGGGGGLMGGFMSGLVGMAASYDVGTDYVPKTGLALIHKGERVVPAAENASGNFGKSMNIVNQFTIAQPADRRTQTQIASLAARSAGRAVRRNG